MVGFRLFSVFQKPRFRFGFRLTDLTQTRTAAQANGSVLSPYVSAKRDQMEIRKCDTTCRLGVRSPGHLCGQSSSSIHRCAHPYTYCSNSERLRLLSLSLLNDGLVKVRVTTTDTLLPFDFAGVRVVWRSKLKLDHRCAHTTTRTDLRDVIGFTLFPPLEDYRDWIYIIENMKYNLLMPVIVRAYLDFMRNFEFFFYEIWLRVYWCERACIILIGLVNN